MHPPHVVIGILTARPPSKRQTLNLSCHTTTTDAGVQGPETFQSWSSNPQITADRLVGPPESSAPAFCSEQGWLHCQAVSTQLLRLLQDGDPTTTSWGPVPEHKHSLCEGFFPFPAGISLACACSSPGIFCMSPVEYGGEIPLHSSCLQNKNHVAPSASPVPILFPYFPPLPKESAFIVCSTPVTSYPILSPEILLLPSSVTIH